MSSNVSRTLNLNHLTFAKNTNNDLMNAYIKKLYRRIPGSSVGAFISNQPAVQPNRYARQGDAQILSPNILRKNSKRRLRTTVESTATMTLIKNANTMAIHSPMAKFYNSRRYHSSASTSSTAIVSKRYNTKPRKRVVQSRPTKVNDISNSVNYYRPAEMPKKPSGFHNAELMNIDIALKQLIALGPQRTTNSQPIRRVPSHVDPLTGWNHPPDIRVFTVPSNLAQKPMVAGVNSRHNQRLNNSFMGRPQKRSLWAAASKDFSPIKKPISSIDFVMRHGEQQVKSLKKASTSERLINDSSEMIKQERQNQLFRQKTKMLQELLQMSEQQRKVKECGEDEIKPRKWEHERVARQMTSKTSIKPQKHLTKPVPPRENLRQSIESLSTINVFKPSAGAEPIKLVTSSSQLSVQELLMGTGRQQKLHHLHDRLKTQYRRNYLLQKQEITNNKQVPEKQALQGKHQTAKQVERSPAANLELRQIKSMFNLPTTKVTSSPTAAVLNMNKRKQRLLQARNEVYRHTPSYPISYPQPYAQTYQVMLKQDETKSNTPTQTRAQTVAISTQAASQTQAQKQALASSEPKTKTQKKISETQAQAESLQEPPPHLLQGIKKHGFHARIEPETQFSESTKLHKDDSYLTAIHAAYKKISENSLENLIKKCTKPFNASAGQNRRY